MRIPLAPAGLREMTILSLLFGGPAALFLWLWIGGGSVLWLVPAVLFTLLWAGGLAFFRDPERVVPGGTGILVSPADGKVTEITELTDYPDIGEPALKIGIFLSVLDVHINRSPCSGVVRAVRYRRGQFLDARHPQSGELNEVNTIVIQPDEPGAGPLVVRQITGLIARRIVCSVKEGDHVDIGQRVGLIKFGSRTELIVPRRNGYASAVAIGDMVHGTSTVLARKGDVSRAGAAATGVGAAT